jgi:membrane dipeptidase
MMMEMSSMRTLAPTAALLVFAMLARPVTAGAQMHTPPNLSEDELLKKAHAIHDRVMTLDTHVDIEPGRVPATDYATAITTKVNLPKMEAGGLDAVFFSIYVGQTRGDSAFTAAAYKRVYDQAMAKIRWVHDLTEKVAPKRIGLALSPEDAKRIYASGRKVAFMGVENAYSIGEDLSNIKKFADLGVRYMSLSHNGHSQFSDSNTGETEGWKWYGLSPLGRKAVAELNKWGIMIDVSHPSKESMMETIKLSKAPIIASHSGIRTICNHSRNMDYEQLLALKQNGGVIQMVALGDYVRCNPAGDAVRNAALAALRTEFGITGGGRGGRGGGGGRGGPPGGAGAGGAGGAAGGAGRASGGAGGRAAGGAAGGAGGGAAGGGGRGAGRGAAPDTGRVFTVDSLPPARRSEYDRRLAAIDAQYPATPAATVKDFVDHIDYGVNLIGIDHVGISSDFDGGGGIQGWNDASETFNVTLEMVRRGYSEQEIAKIWSGNLLRVLGDVQRIAKTLQMQGT